MSSANPFPANRWPVAQAMILAVACLLAGIAGGYILRLQLASPAPASAQPAAVQPTSPASPAAQLRAMADANAASLLVRLQADPNNPDLLTSLGNLYYDAQQFPVAIDYYQRSLKLRPSDNAVRTDLGTAYWYLGNADSAIAEFDKALAAEPTNPNALFNRGVVEWQGKKDIPAALTDWHKLLAANPTYPDKEKVQQLIDRLQLPTPSPADALK